MKRGEIGAWMLLASLLAMAGIARAHPLAPSLLEIREGSAGRAQVLWKTPRQRPPGSRLEPHLPEQCVAAEAPETSALATAWLQRWAVDCGDRGLVGGRIRVSGIGASQANVLLRVQLADGRQLRTVLTERETAYVVPETESAGEVFASYAALGTHHIFEGLDHLAFVLALVLLVPGGRRLVWTVTSFTLGHSITLALATLGWVAAPTRWIELCIAASVVVVALEALRRLRGEPTRWDGFPYALACGFGLLHGFGFAGALTEIGLPPDAIPLSLFAFNVGIELGQLAFVGGLLALGALLAAAPWRLPRWARLAPPYAIGALGWMWVLERATDAL